MDTKTTIENFATRIELAYAWHQLDSFLVHPVGYARVLGGRTWRARFVVAEQGQRQVTRMSWRALQHTTTPKDHAEQSRRGDYSRMHVARAKDLVCHTLTGMQRYGLS
jgi:hypothetical protein